MRRGGREAGELTPKRSGAGVCAQDDAQVRRPSPCIVYVWLMLSSLTSMPPRFVQALAAQDQGASPRARAHTCVPSDRPTRVRRSPICANLPGPVRGQGREAQGRRHPHPAVGHHDGDRGVVPPQVGRPHQHRQQGRRRRAFPVPAPHLSRRSSAEPLLRCWPSRSSAAVCRPSRSAKSTASFARARRSSPTPCASRASCRSRWAAGPAVRLSFPPFPCA